MASTPLNDQNRRAETALKDGAYEDVCTLLDEVISRLEAGNLSLSDGLDMYELGVRLSERAQHLLTRAELRVSQLSIDHGCASDAAGPDSRYSDDGATGETPF